MLLTQLLRSSLATADEAMRRITDVTVSLIGTIILLPLLLILSAWIRLDSPGPIFYRATRVGKDGTAFRVYKFRTMVSGADKRGPGITTAHDDRITRAGHWLRRTKVDELPQLINVLKGDMSLVGPRPEDPRYVALYTPDQLRILAVRPGITSAASLKYRNEAELLQGLDWENTYCTHILPAKLQIDLDYVERRTLITDVRLILITIGSMFE